MLTFFQRHAMILLLNKMLQSKGGEKMNQLAAWRSSKGMTQEAVAVLVGVDKSSVAKWETGKAYPKALMLQEIAKLLKVTEGEIIEAITAARREQTA